MQITCIQWICQMKSLISSNIPEHTALIKNPILAAVPFYYIFVRLADVTVCTDNATLVKKTILFFSNLYLRPLQ